MRIIYSLHAVERMRQRGISRELVALCIQDPGKSEELEGVYRCVKKINDKVIIVIYRRENDKFVVVTTYLSSKLHKYLGWSILA